MENSNIEETVTISSDNAAFEIKIKDFRSATEPLKIRATFVQADKKFEYFFHARIIPNHVENTEFWLAFNPILTIHTDLINYGHYNYLLCTVSIIDVDGNSRIPRYFKNNLSETFPYPTEVLKYLKKSTILEREEEFLPDGVLTLRVDFIFDSRSIDALYKKDFKYTPFLHSTRNKYELTLWKDIFTENSNIISYTVFDYTCKILNLPQFYVARKRFGVYGFYPEPLPSSELKEVNPDIYDHVWIFDIKDEDQRHLIRCLVSFDEREESVGTRLLRASPVLRQMVNSPMREQQDKRIEFVNISGHPTFRSVLAFLDRREIPTKRYNVVDLYEFSHFYEMEELQRKCAEHLVKHSKHDSELEELDRIADQYDDKNLSELLKIRRNELENFTEPPFIEDDVPNSDCFV